ncbi:MAG: helix-turn-helix domain-containing protein [Prevotella sp.]|nr:helix-turn-helix domain-containing protein [Prevotella sp.]
MKRLVSVFLACFLVCISQLTAQTATFLPSDQFSNSLIADLCQDRQGSLWIATDYGLNRYDGYAFQTFLHNDADSTSLANNMVVTLLCDSQGRLWVGTNRGLDLFNPATESFSHIALPISNKPHISNISELPDGTILAGTAGYGIFAIDKDGSQVQRYETGIGQDFYSRIFRDSQGRMWYCNYDENIYMAEPGGSVHTYRSEHGNPLAITETDGKILVMCMHGFMAWQGGSMQNYGVDLGDAAGQDAIFSYLMTAPDNNIYIGTRGMGLYHMAMRQGGIPRLERVNVNTIGIDMNTAKISSMLFDNGGNLWVGCQRKGLVLLPQSQQAFCSWSFEANGVRLGSNVSSVCEGDGGVIWTTVQGVGIYGFNRDGRIVSHPTAPDACEFIFRDKDRQYWVGSDDGLYSYDPQTGAAQLKVSFDCDKFNDMTDDGRGHIFISTFAKGFCMYDKQTGRVRNFTFDQRDSIRGKLCNNWVMAMMPDQDGRIWLATSNGVSCYDPVADSFRSLGWEVLLQGTMCYSLCETSRGHILIGTDNGLYIYKGGTDTEASQFMESDDLKGKLVYYIVEDNQGDIWCSTSDGIWQFDVETRTFIGHVGGNGLTKREYVLGVGVHTDDDRIFFGHNDGLTYFIPSNVRHEANTTQKSLQLTGLRVGDQYVKAGTVLNGINVTDGKALSDCKYFTLSYLDHTVTLSFSQFDFTTSQNAVLQYRVNNDQWVSMPQGQNEFTLGHLQPGTYRIEARMIQGNSQSQSKVVIITVRSPWYKSTMAYFIYFLLLAALATYIFITMRRRANQQLNEEKMKFLINATHDIRSPLTIILSALKKVKQGNAAEGQPATGAIDTIEHNSQRILNLVNQILDVRKIDKQQMHLHCQQTEMVTFIQGICKMFEFSAQERGISFSFSHEGIDKLEAWVDRTQFDKVISNLLSNAFKYSNDNGEVNISLSQSGDQFCIKVIDKGIGVDQETQKHIFDRFYQGRNSDRANTASTGIGLNLCKMIVDMHHGTITAANRTDGQQGSLFTVTLPLGNSHLKPEEIDSKPMPKAVEAQSGQGGVATSRKHVLIVDDDPEIGQYIKQELSRYFRFTICHNGKEGLRELLTGDFDIVVSDVMMPEMDGFTMLRMIKTNMNISHLPVIMLTSKADVANRLEGLERGADAFLAKPFDMEELHLTIDNLLQSRQHLKGKFSGAQQQQDKVEQIEVKGNDEVLMERIMKAVNKNLSDSDFNVEMLCQEVGISRAQLHRKMKEMTGLSTSEFIRNIRLEQAARLLKEQKVNVTQVAYAVGFSNLAHFSTIFRRHFGVTPTEYSENKG